ncbi:hypothetical protein [Phycicoccus jejuensis]|uniref:hypothetical protein n=1 Tax=Phycicoccus jejuensis TaxID=367299 RepID=UPI0004C34AB7|nr:hypothetical protein [Phycicoccus jejuensis]
MRRFSAPSFLAGVVVAASLVAVPASALPGSGSAAGLSDSPEGVTPSLSVDPLSFRLGESIDATTASSDWCDTVGYHSDIPLRLTWSATDAGSGLQGFDVIEYSDNVLTYEAQDTSQTSFDVRGITYDGQCGGGPGGVRYTVKARDHVGNTAMSRLSGSSFVSVWQQDGKPNPPYSTYTGDLGVTRVGTWQTAPCVCFDAGSTWYSTKGGSSLTYAVTTGPGQTFAVVMEKNSNRGRVGIRVNGGAATTVDTYSSTGKHRVIVWQSQLTEGTSTITVTNQATAGRPRVDIDAVMLTSPPTGEVPMFLTPDF